MHEDPDVCLSCRAKEEEKSREHPKWEDGSVKYQGVEYHVHDFIYTLIGPESKPYVIAQIVDIDASRHTIHIQIMTRDEDRCKLDHYDLIDNGSEAPYKDSRMLTMTTQQQQISFEELEGKCWVEEISNVQDVKEYKQAPDNFYTHDTITHCQQCLEERLEDEEVWQRFYYSTDKLSALDIFAGCGGLTVGMDNTGVIETTHSIEFNPDAAKTFQRNFPTSTVHNQCANVLLTRAIASHHQKIELDPMDDFRGKPLRPMPGPNDIDFIYCGPPCQGFSDLNQHKKPGEIKNTLVCSAMSYVDFYRPSYFLLENVRGLVHYKLGKDRINNGVLKFIIRCLTSMGYQVNHLYTLNVKRQRMITR